MMFQYVRKLNGVAIVCTMQVLVAASQTIVKGDLLTIAAGYATKVTAGIGSINGAKIIGIANGAITTPADPASTTPLEITLVDSFTVLKVINYTGGAKDVAVQADLFTTMYDIQAAGTIDFNDTTGGFLIPIAIGDGVTTEVVVAAASLWNKGTDFVV